MFDLRKAEGMNSYLFLDFDGVLNSEAHFAQFDDREPNRDENLDPVAIERLNRIVEATDCKIVISSTWRHWASQGNLQRLLARRGFRHELSVVGMTPWLGGPRNFEIQRWMDYYSVRVEQICILDDWEDMGHLAHRLVKTSWETGLLDGHVERVIAMLGTIVC